jgi:hypothetical protein
MDKKTNPIGYVNEIVQKEILKKIFSIHPTENNTASQPEQKCFVHVFGIETEGIGRTKQAAKTEAFRKWGDEWDSRKVSKNETISNDKSVDFSNEEIPEVETIPSE